MTQTMTIHLLQTPKMTTTMKKQLITIAVALLTAGVLTTGCSKDDAAIETQKEQTAKDNMLFTATVEAKGGTTRSVNESGVTTWVVNEQIAVYYEKDGGTYGTATANVDEVNEGKATISATLSDAKNGGTVKFVYPASIVNATGDDIDATKLATQHGTIADISANFDAATATATLATNGTTCGTTANITFTNQVLIGKFTPTFSSAAIDGITTLTVSDGTNTYTVTPTSGTFGTTGIYVAMLPVTSQVVSLTAETATQNYVYPGKSVTLEVGKLYTNLAIPMSLPLKVIRTDVEPNVEISKDGSGYFQLAYDQNINYYVGSYTISGVGSGNIRAYGAVSLTFEEGTVVTGDIRLESSEGKIANIILNGDATVNGDIFASDLSADYTLISSAGGNHTLTVNGMAGYSCWRLGEGATLRYSDYKDGDFYYGYVKNGSGTADITRSIVDGYAVYVGSGSPVVTVWINSSIVWSGVYYVVFNNNNTHVTLTDTGTTVIDEYGNTYKCYTAPLTAGATSYTVYNPSNNAIASGVIVSNGDIYIYGNYGDSWGYKNW